MCDKVSKTGTILAPLTFLPSVIVEVTLCPVPALLLVTQWNSGITLVLWRKAAPTALPVLAQFAWISKRVVSTGSVEQSGVIITLSLRDATQKNLGVQALYVQTTETYVLPPKQDTAVHIHPQQYKRGTCLHFIYWNLYCPHAVIVFLGWGVNSSASVNANLLQATIPNTVIPPARTRPISSVFVVSKLTTVPKVVLHNPKSY
jgi:hypothetical protein